MSALTALGRRFEQAPDIDAFLAIWLEERGVLQGEAAATFNTYYGSFLRAFSPRMRRFYRDQIIEASTYAKPGRRLLEIGCGLGTESLWLAMRGAHVVAVDVREDRLAAARERHAVLQRELGRDLFCHFSHASVLDLPERATFDLIWLEQTFHHLEPRADVVRKIARLLSPGGHVVISEANALNLPLQVQLLLRRGLPRVEMMDMGEGRQHPYGVERITTASAIRAAFAREGVRPLSVRHFRMFPNSAPFDFFAPVEQSAALKGLPFLYTHFNYVGERQAA